MPACGPARWTCAVLLYSTTARARRAGPQAGTSGPVLVATHGVQTVPRRGVFEWISGFLGGTRIAKIAKKWSKSGQRPDFDRGEACIYEDSPKNGRKSRIFGQNVRKSMIFDHFWYPLRWYRSKWSKSGRWPDFDLFLHVFSIRVPPPKTPKSTKKTPFRGTV